jgi:tRNA(Ile)-lysidine synthase
LHTPELLPAGSPLLLAVSGGQDSMALLQLLLHLRRLHRWELFVWHGDHCWRPASGAAAVALKAWVEQQDIPVAVERADPPPVGEAQAREWRYRALAMRALEVGCRHVLTGHTATDRAETVLLNMVRGTGLKGLSSLRRCRPLGPDLQLVRPLLGLSREETARFCADWSVPVWPDPSNADPRFSRNRLRLEVLPVLEGLHPGATRRISALAERLEQAPLTDLLPLALGQLRDPGQPDQLRRTALMALSPLSQTEVLRAWLKQEAGQSLPTEALELLGHRLRSGQAAGSLDLAGGWRLEWERGMLRLVSPSSGVGGHTATEPRAPTDLSEPPMTAASP